MIKLEKCICGNIFELIIGTKETKIYTEAAKTVQVNPINIWESLDGGSLNTALICPHCQTQGRIYIKYIKRKKGISGGKVMGGLLTGGISLFVTGLSRKEQVTQAHCANCNLTWEF